MGDEQKKVTPVTAAAERQGKKIRWDDAAMQTAYANVVNVTSTREEMMLLFGTNQTSAVGTPNEIVVQLTHRMILNPFAAKRLQVILSGVLKVTTPVYRQNQMAVMTMRSDADIAKLKQTAAR